MQHLQQLGFNKNTIFICLIFIFTSSVSFAQEENDPFKRMDDKFDEMTDRMEQSHQDYLARQDAKYKAWVSSIEAKWIRKI